MGKATILIVEDDPDVVETLQHCLHREGYETIVAGSGDDVVALAADTRPDIIIAETVSPGLDDFELCDRLKGQPATADIPIIILTVKSDEADKIRGLELGADDYMTKPFSPRELIARVRAVMRRNQIGPADAGVRKGQLLIDTKRHRVTVAGQEVLLTLTEFRLLQFLAKRPGVVHSRDSILSQVAGGLAAGDRAVDAHIKSLRRKMGDARDYIETVRGSGYRFRQ